MESGSCRIRDVDGQWGGDKFLLPRDSAAMEHICRVPWWVWRISVDVPAEDGGRQHANVRRMAPRSRLWWEKDSTVHEAPLAVGDNRLYVDLVALADDGALSKTPSFDDSAGSTSHCQPVLLRAVREEPLRHLIPQLKPYETAQLSVVSFVAGFCFALHLGLPSFIAAPLLAAIPVSRICPELLCYLHPRQNRANSHFRRTLAVAATCAFIIWLAFSLLAVARRAQGPSASPTELALPEDAWLSPTAHPVVLSPSVDCASLGGLDCSTELSDWAGSGNCAILAETDGTCSAYCERHKRTCKRAADDDGTGSCSLGTGGHHRQMTDGNGCFQDWKMQVCACSSSSDAEPMLGPQPPARLAPHALLRLAVPASPPSSPAVPLVSSVTQAPPSSSSLPGGGRGEQTGGEPPGGTTPGSAPPDSCLLPGVRYAPLDMPGRGGTRARSPELCQARCMRTPGCAHFTWWPSSACHLQDFRAKPQADADAVAGPSSCSDDEELAALRGDTPAAPDALAQGPEDEPKGRGEAGHAQAPADFTLLQQRLQLPAEGSPALVAVVFAVCVALVALGALDASRP